MKRFQPGNLVKGAHDKGFFRHVQTTNDATVGGHNSDVKLCGRGDSNKTTSDHKK